MLTMSLGARKNIIRMGLYHLESMGNRFKDGAFEACVAASVWARSKNEFASMIEQTIEEYKIPDGIEMPWGITVKP